jgi:hypothetical protein
MKPERSSDPRCEESVASADRGRGHQSQQKLGLCFLRKESVSWS